MRTANFTEFRKNLSHYLDAVVDDHDMMVIPRGKDKGVVVISLDEYNALHETAYILSSPAMMAAIKEAEEDIAQGRYVTLNGHEEIQRYLDNIGNDEDPEV